MTSLLKVKQLEKRYAGAHRKIHKTVICRSVDEQNHLIDKDGNLLSESEMKRMRAEDEELAEAGGQVIYVRSYEFPPLTDK